MICGAIIYVSVGKEQAQTVAILKDGIYMIFKRKLGSIQLTTPF
jgi:hypothetical protein